MMAVLQLLQMVIGVVIVVVSEASTAPPRSGRWKQEDPLGFTVVSSCTRDNYYVWCRRKGGRRSLSNFFLQPAALIVGQANKY